MTVTLSALTLNGSDGVGREKILEGRVDTARVAIEPRDAVEADESIGEGLGPTEALEPQEGVVLLREADAVTGELAGQPLMTVKQ